MDMKHVKYLALVLCIGNLSPVILGHRAVSVPRREFCHYGGKPAYMVLVGVRAEHIKMDMKTCKKC